jgi:hypothetical protein
MEQALRREKKRKNAREPGELEALNVSMLKSIAISCLFSCELMILNAKGIF